METRGLAFRLRAWAGLALACLGWALPFPAAAAPTGPDALRDIEQRLRGRAEEAETALLALANAEPAGSALQVEALYARGAMLVTMGDGAAVERVAQQLDALALKPAGQAAADSRREPSTALAAVTADVLRAAWLQRYGSLGRADRLLTQALPVLPADTPASLRLRFLALQGSVRQGQGRLDDAVRLNQQAQTLADQIAPDWRRAEARSRLAYSLFLAQQLDQAHRISLEALALAEKSADPMAIFSALNTEGILLGALGKPEGELLATKRAIEIARSAGAERDEVLGLANLADHYLKHGDYQTAYTLAQQARPLAQRVKDSSSESVAAANAGLALISLGRRDEGIRLVRESLVIEERTGEITNMTQILKEMGEYLEKAGFLPEAWAAFNEHRRIADQVFQQQLQQAVLELQESYEHDKRQRELALLNTEKSLGEATLTGRVLQQRLWAVASVVGLLLLAVAVVLVRRMRHSNVALQHSNAQLKVTSERDALTGLANRRHFQQVMAAATEANGSDAFDGAMLLIDIDHFKRINDQHGHAAGDSVLVAVAERLRAALRGHDLAVRWGGEEFLVVVRALPPVQVEALAQRLLAAIGSEPVLLGRQPLVVTASIGFATFPLQPQLQPVPWEQAIELVDTAMYLAKAHGRNRAYGVRALHGDPQQPWRPQTGTLEGAWREGLAELAHLPGPAPAEVAP